MAEAPTRYEALLEAVPCNLCGADDYTVVYPPRYAAAAPADVVQTFRSSGDTVLVEQLVRCRRCGLQYLNPRLPPEVILEAYRAGTDETFVSQAASRERSFARSLTAIEREAPDRGRILDVGTAGGSFLAVARRRGWEVAGCEVNRWLCEWGRGEYGIDIHPGTIFDMKPPDARFDVVTLWDVLEHTPDPRAVLAECRRVLRPGGLLVVNVPDVGSLVARGMGRRWVFLLSVHLYYFTVGTLGRMLAETGFRMAGHRRHWQTLELGYIFRRMQPYIAWASALGQRLTRVLGMERLPVPYWMGQTLVLARRTDPPREA